LVMRDETEKERKNYNRTRKIRISSILFFFKLFSELFSVCVMLVILDETEKERENYNRKRKIRISSILFFQSINQFI
jgi:hypothetical protein